MDGRRHLSIIVYLSSKYISNIYGVRYTVYSSIYSSITIAESERKARGGTREGGPYSAWPGCMEKDRADNAGWDGKTYFARPNNSQTQTRTRNKAFSLFS